MLPLVEVFDFILVPLAARRLLRIVARSLFIVPRSLPIVPLFIEPLFMLPLPLFIVPVLVPVLGVCDIEPDVVVPVPGVVVELGVV